MLIGGSIAFMFSALAIRAVGRTAGTVVEEVRRQFRERKIMEGIDKPEYGKVIDICTDARHCASSRRRRCSPCSRR